MGNGAQATDLEGRWPELGARRLASAAWHQVPVREERDERERKGRTGGRRWEAGGREGSGEVRRGPAALRRLGGNRREVGALSGGFPGHLLPKGQGGGVDGWQCLQAHADRLGVQQVPRSEACH